MKEACIVAMFILISVCFVSSGGPGINVNLNISVNFSSPQIFLCSERALDESIHPWRISGSNQNLSEFARRNSSYLFDGERYEIDVAVLDNKVEDIEVDLILESNDTYGINCQKNFVNFTLCNLSVFNNTNSYTCFVDILDSEHMYGNVNFSILANNTFTRQVRNQRIANFFVNPIVSLGVNGDTYFTNINPGDSSYRNLTINNTSEGGVILDMFIAGRDVPAVGPDLGRCQNVNSDGVPIMGSYVNYLPLGAFRYHAENNGFSTNNDLAIDAGYSSVIRDVDLGYVNINEQINDGFEEAMFDDAEIIQEDAINITGDPDSIADNIYQANLLYSGENMDITFRLNLPDPCYGEFASQEGSLFIWAEVV